MRILDFIRHGGPDWTKSRTGAASAGTPSCGMGMVYVSTASSSMLSMPLTKLRMRVFRSGKVPSWKKDSIFHTSIFVIPAEAGIQNPASTKDVVVA